MIKSKQKYFLDFYYHKRIGKIWRESKSRFFIIRLKQFNRVRCVLGFYDFQNNFIFFNFHFFVKFMLKGSFYFLKNPLELGIAMADFFIFILKGLLIYTENYGNFFFLQKQEFFLFVRYCYKIICYGYLSRYTGLVGAFSWGSIFRKKYKVLKSW